MFMSFVNTLPFCSRSRFFAKLVGFSDRNVRRQPHEPAVQAIVVQLLHQLSFRPNAAERACTAIAPEGSRGILRSNRAYQGYGSAHPAHYRQAPESLADGSATPTSRRDVRKQPALIHKCALHTSLHQSGQKGKSPNSRYSEGFFSRLLVSAGPGARSRR